MIQLPKEFIVSKFYELGYYPKYNKYNDTYQCSCPICREGASLGKKKRCYYFPRDNYIFCHNCGWSGKPEKWICEVSSVSFSTLLNEAKNYDGDYIQSYDEPIPTTFKTATLPQDSIDLLNPTQVVFYKDTSVVSECLTLLKQRRLDTACNRPKKLFVSLVDPVHKNRLIIPFFNERNLIEYYQTRTVLKTDTERPKYLSKINADKCLFNINTVDPDSDCVFIFEGPIDAFFVKNSVAVAGITEGKHTFTPRQQEQINSVLKLHTRIWVLDSQWQDFASLKKTRSLLEAGEKVFIWPEKYGKRFKDFNDIAVFCKLDEITKDFIQKNTYEGIIGILKLAEIEKNFRRI